MAGSSVPSRRCRVVEGKSQPGASTQLSSALQPLGMALGHADTSPRAALPQQHPAPLACGTMAMLSGGGMGMPMMLACWALIGGMSLQPGQRE